MKSVLITFDQAYYERIMALLDRLGCRGFTFSQSRSMFPMTVTPKCCHRLLSISSFELLS